MAYAHGTRRGQVIAVDAAQQCRLAGPRRANQGNAFARRHDKPDIVEHGQTRAALQMQREDLGEVVDDHLLFT